MLDPVRHDGPDDLPWSETPGSQATEVSIASRVPLSMLQALAAAGLDAAVLTQQAGLDAAVLADPDGRVPGPQMERLWDAAVAATADADLGLHLGAGADAGPLTVVGYVLQSAPTLGAALDAFARYITLFTDGLEARLVRPAPGALAAEAVLEMTAVGSPATNYLLRRPRQPMEATVVGAVVIAGALVGRPLPLTAVEFVHDGDGADEARRVLSGGASGVRVAFGSDRYRVRFEAAALGWPVLQASPVLLAAFEAQAEAAVEALAARDPRPLHGQALRAVTDRLRGEAPTVEDVAAALDLGVRTLQRRLEEEGTSFTAILDEARHALALQHLARADRSVSEVAFLLGFSEPSAFTRAFRRWNGQAPSTYRTRTMGEADRPSV